MSGASKLRVGVDVPWVTSWSAEVQTGIGPCETVDGRLAIRQSERPGIGKPQYSLNHLQRQRASVIKMLCPMCGGQTAPDNRWSLTAKVETAGALRSRGLGQALPSSIANSRTVLNAGGISPGHLSCMERSADQCPHLRASPDLALRQFPEQWVLTPLLVETTLSGPQLFLACPASAPKAVISFIQICGIMSA